MSKICFIVGHGKSRSGGYDPGACAGGYEEYRIAKEIAEYAQAYYNANYAEQADIMNQNADLYLTDRIKKVNAADYDFVAEIHLNAGGGTGTECYYHKGSQIGRAYADAICKEISAALGIKQRANGTDDGGDKVKIGAGGSDYFAIIRETGCDAALIECCFIDTASDVAKVAIAEGQALCGEAIAKAVAAVRGVKRKAAARVLHKVQTGAFSDRKNAEKQLAEVRKAGFKDAFIVTEAVED